MESKQIKFLSQYYGQKVLLRGLENTPVYNVSEMWLWKREYKLLLKNLCMLTDEQCYTIFYKVYQKKVDSSNLKIERNGNMIHLTSYDNDIDREQHIGICCDYGTLNCNTRFYSTKDNIKSVSKHKTNIGEIQNTSRVIPWTVFDYLRSCGFALPYDDMTLSMLVKEGWIVYDEVSDTEKRINNFKKSDRIPDSVKDSVITDTEKMEMHLKLQKVAIKEANFFISKHRSELDIAVGFKNKLKKSFISKVFHEKGIESYNNTIKNAESKIKFYKRFRSKLDRGMELIPLMHSLDRKFINYFNNNDKNSVVIISNSSESYRKLIEKHLEKYEI